MVSKKMASANSANTTCSRDNLQFVIDALEMGWSVRKSGNFYEISNVTDDNLLKIPPIKDATTITALFEDVRSNGQEKYKQA